MRRLRIREWVIYRRDYVALILSTIVSLSLISTNNNSQSDAIRTVVFGAFGFILEKATLLQRYDDIYEENQWLRQENARLMLETSRFKEARYENERLRSLLEFRAASELALLPAKVLGKKEGVFERSIILNIGKDHGIEKNMAVVTSQGLVGKVYSVGDGHAVVQLLLDASFRVSSTVQRSRVAGVTRRYSSNSAFLGEVPKRSDVQVGDMVVTSGLSTIFPGGLAVGRVIEVDDETKGMFMDVVLQPTVDFDRLEEVFVVKMKPTPLAELQ